MDVTYKPRPISPDASLKTLLDLAVTIPGLLLISPLLGIVALLIKLDSPGPALYRRRVLGLHSREFDALKFRTMYTDWKKVPPSEAVSNQFIVGIKPKCDPRVTRFGRFLRKYSLDELPQLINVLKGEMSLVGPRITTAEELGLYGKSSAVLLSVRPGITGLWQISGRADVSYQRRVQLDMQYVRNRSIWLDVQILLRTLPAVIGGKGAY
jgi:lipopolysaccharide/colanic/teichoic acid biosynthesis glycosyltransferase